MEQWYYLRGGEQVGPISRAELQRVVDAGQLRAGDLVWAEGMPDWVDVRTVPGLRAGGGRTPPPAPPAAPASQAAELYQHVLPQASPPPNYLVQAILVTFLCCTPFGVVALVYAAQVEGKFRTGDVAGAQRFSDSARTWCWVALAAGLLTLCTCSGLVGLRGLAEVVPR